MLAELCLLDRDADAGIAVLDTARRQMQEHDEYLWKAEVLRLEGEFRTLDGASPERADSCLEAALSASLDQGAAAFALRAATSLVRTAADPEERMQRETRLRAILSSLTEGIGSEDYIKARNTLNNSIV